MYFKWICFTFQTNYDRAKDTVINMGAVLFSGIHVTNFLGVIVLAFAKYIFFFYVIFRWLTLIFMQVTDLQHLLLQNVSGHCSDWRNTWACFVTSSSILLGPRSNQQIITSLTRKTCTIFVSKYNIIWELLLIICLWAPFVEPYKPATSKEVNYFHQGNKTESSAESQSSTNISYEIHENIGI